MTIPVHNWEMAAMVNVSQTSTFLWLNLFSFQVTLCILFIKQSLSVCLKGACKKFEDCFFKKDSCSFNPGLTMIAVVSCLTSFTLKQINISCILHVYTPKYWNNGANSLNFFCRLTTFEFAIKGWILDKIKMIEMLMLSVHQVFIRTRSNKRFQIDISIAKEQFALYGHILINSRKSTFSNFSVSALGALFLSDWWYTSTLKFYLDCHFILVLTQKLLWSSYTGFPSVLLLCAHNHKHTCTQDFLFTNLMWRELVGWTAEWGPALQMKMSQWVSI